jgi:peptidyl-prolyl cis-trans isomerase SurA
MTTGDKVRGVEKKAFASMTLTQLASGVALAALLVLPAQAQAPAADPAAPTLLATAGPAPASLTPAAAPVKRPLSEGVVALVNDELVSSFDLRQRMLLLIATSGVQPNEQNLPGIQQQALRSLVDEHLEMQELKKFDVKIKDAEVDEEISAIASENKTTKDRMLASLQAAGVRPQTLRDELRAQIGWRELVGGRYGSRARVGDVEVEQTIQRIAAATAKPQFLVGEIYLDAQTVGGMDEAMNGARQLVDQLVKGAPFTAVARQFSNAPSAASGGDAGWLISGEMDPAVEQALIRMQPGQLSLPIPSDKGVWIVYLREKKAGGVSTIVHLEQAAIKLPGDAPDADVAAATAKLEGLRHKLTCENIEKESAKAGGVIGADLGESDLNDLTPEFKDAAANLKVGETSAPIRTAAGLHVIAMCARKLGGADLPSKEQVENKLYGQQITMLAQRYLRDLRNSAMIETR